MDIQTVPYQPGMLLGRGQLSVSVPEIIIFLFTSFNLLKFQSAQIHLFFHLKLLLATLLVLLAVMLLREKFNSSFV